MVFAFREIVPEDPRATLDILWVDRTTKEVKLETDRLELELKGYKNNLIKESIRVRSPLMGGSMIHKETTTDLLSRWAVRIWVDITISLETLQMLSKHIPKNVNPSKRRLMLLS